MSEDAGMGASRGAHLRSAIEQLKKNDPRQAEELEKQLSESERVLPPEAETVWKAFCDLAARRNHTVIPGPAGSGKVNYFRLSFTDLDAWGKLHGIELDPWETDAFGRLDELWFARKKGK